jgi:superfamily II helicase
LIKIETICEDNKNNDNNETETETENENENMNVISSERIQLTSENKIQGKIASTRINRSIPEPRRIVQENQQFKTPTDMIKNLKENTQIFKNTAEKEMEAHEHKVTENAVQVQETTNTCEFPILRNNETNFVQSVDTRLILNNNNNTTAEEFISIIREYNTYKNSPINDVGAYIINRVECRYKI